MTVTPGARLGPYEVLSLLGVGGMGEVYRAVDTRVDRPVALKVLPEEFFEDEERRARFGREARTLASLNHPGIATLYSFEEIPGPSSSRHVLVMELVEGETLASRLTKGAMSLEQLLPAGIQIADALDRAHRQGIVHRDFKPGNVMLTRAGVKLLDFGLAKTPSPRRSGRASRRCRQASPQHRSPQQGTILGTFQYMAPEQLEGNEADARTRHLRVRRHPLRDGHRKEGLRRQEPGEPHRLDPEGRAAARVVARAHHAAGARPRDRACLAKDPDDRVQTAHDVGSSSSGSRRAARRRVCPRRSRTGARAASACAWTIAAAALVLAGVLTGIVARTGRKSERLVRSSLPPPEGTSFWLEANGPGPVIVSPDGRQVAFTAADGAGKVNLYVRALDAADARMLSGTEGAMYPFWSPDGRSLGFFTAGKLKTIEATGGSPQTLCGAPEGKGGTWSQAGVIVFTPGPTSPLSKVSEKGGETTAVTKLDASRGDDSHRHPRFLPDGKHFLYVARSTKAGSEGHYVVAASLDAGAEKVLLRSPAAALYASGNLLYLRETTLMARPFDPARLAFTGEASPVAEKILMPAIGTAVGVFSASQNGILAYQTARGETTSRLQWFTRDGKPDGTLGEPADFGQALLSPDGKQAAVTIRDQATGTHDIWIFDIARGVRTRFTFDPGEDVSPLWSPDGGALVFSSNRKGHYDLYRKALDGSSEEEALYTSDADKGPVSWTAGGRTLVFDEAAKDAGVEVRTLALDGARKAESWSKTKFNEVNSALSPDGRWLPYSTDESGRWEVYVTSFPRTGRKWQISTNGGAYAFWSADGKEILYHDISGMIWAVAVSVRGETLEIGQGRPLFRAPGPNPTAPSFSATSDHQRFLVVGEGQKPNALVDLVVNWPIQLRGGK